MKPSVSFVVLALNEAENVGDAVATVLQAVEGCDLSAYELVLVDDGSTDDTYRVMESLAGRHPHITVVRNESNLGLGGAYKRGVAVARGDYAMIVAGDNAMPASDMRTILERLGDADIILPHLANPSLRPWVRRMGSKAFTTVINLLFGLRIRYYQGMVPRRELLSQIEIRTNSYAFMAESVVKLVKAGYTYAEVAIHNTPSRRDRSVALQPKRVLGVIKAVGALFREIRKPGAIPKRLDPPTQ